MNNISHSLDKADNNRLLKRQVLRRLRDGLWSLHDRDDLTPVLKLLADVLKTLKIPFDICSINILDADEPFTLYTHLFFADSGRTVMNQSVLAHPETGTGASLNVHIWENERPLYRPDIECDDPHQERQHIQQLYGPARALINIPFSHGTLGLASMQANVFDPVNIDDLEDLADTLSIGIRRLDDVHDLSHSEARYRTLVETSHLVVLLLDADGAFMYISPQITPWSGYQPTEFYADPRLVQRQTHPQDFRTLGRAFRRALQGETATDVEFRWQYRQGGWRWGSATILPIYEQEEDKPLNLVSMVQTVIQDITERKEAEVRLHASLQEKEVLLQEIHHRVKNNLQIISSLARLQAHHSNDPKTVEMLRESQARIRAMALIHERLYRAQNLSRIDFSDYIGHLVTHLFHSYGVDANRIKTSIDITPVHMDIDTAIPCGLIVNELVSNALKYAFPDDRNGTIKVCLDTSDTQTWSLRISDDGVGLEAPVDLCNAETLGLRLVRILAQQLKGHLELDNANGTAFTIWLPR